MPERLAFPHREVASNLEVDPSELLERFAQHPFANLETYKYFNQRGEQAAQAKQQFIDAALEGNTPETPGFVYPAIGIDDLIQRRDELTELLQAVVRLDMQDERNRLLREKVTDRLHEAGIMILTKLQSELNVDDPLYQSVSYQLGENMREVYGVPEAEQWRGILGYRMSLLREIENRPDAPAAVLEAWRYVQQMLPQDLPIQEPYQPRPETVQWYRQQLLQRLAPAREAVQAAIDSGDILLNETGELDAENIVKATKLALAARGMHGWRVEQTDEANIDTSQERQTIFIPTTRYMTQEQFDEVIQSHEIDEHVARRDNGDKSGEPILGGTGCSGYLAWEEGNGKANEALLRGKIDNEDTAFNYYLSAGLALGLGGEQGWNFGETFDLVWRMRYVVGYLSGTVDESHEARRTVMEKAFDSLQRIFRGTDGRVPGVLFTKDAMTYYLGQTEVWRKWDNDMQQLDDAARQAEHELERSAKIDPLRADHRRVAAAARRAV